MNNIVLYLPFVPRNIDKAAEMIDRLCQMAGSESQVRFILQHPDYRRLFEEEGFGLAYAAHQELYSSTMNVARTLGREGESDSLFANTAEEVFTRSTGRRAFGNPAFKIFLSLIRRKSTEEMN